MRISLALEFSSLLKLVFAPQSGQEIERGLGIAVMPPSITSSPARTSKRPSGDMRSPAWFVCYGHAFSPFGPTIKDRNLGTKSYNNVAEEYKNEKNAKERQKNTPETPTERVRNTGLSE